MRHLLRTLILFLVRLIGAPGAYTSTYRTRQSRPKAPRILLIRPDHLGDLIMTTPILQALKIHAPDAHITMMVGPWSSEVVARHPAIDRLLLCRFPGFQRTTQQPLTPYTLLLHTAWQLRHDTYDLAINLRPDFWWGAALLYLAHITHRIGYAIEPATPFLTHALPFPPCEHSTISNLRLISSGLQALGYPALDEPYTPDRYPLAFTANTDEQAWVTKRLQAVGINAATPIIVIHPGTGAPVKLWRPVAWSHIADKLAYSRAFPHPIRIVLTGSKHEHSLLEEIAQAMSTVPLLMSDTTVGELAALLERACLVLGVDNGPLHLAVAQNRPTVQIFGPTNVRIFGPWGNPEPHVVLTSTYRCPTCPCIPCGRLDFSAEELSAHPCVRLITEQQVETAITILLETGSIGSS